MGVLGRWSSVVRATWSSRNGATVAHDGLGTPDGENDHEDALPGLRLLRIPVAASTWRRAVLLAGVAGVSADDTGWETLRSATAVCAGPVPEGVIAHDALIEAEIPVDRGSHVLWRRSA